MDIPAQDVIEQGSEAWLLSRVGKVTASRISDVMAKGKNGAASASRTNYMSDLIAERLTGKWTEGFKSAAMLRGLELEAEARDAYAFYAGATVAKVSVCNHPTIAWCAASPDAIAGDDGLLEIKCPENAEHLRVLLGGAIPSNYQLQMLWQMACSGRAWVDFASYSPNFPESMKLKIIRFPRDPARIVEIEREVRIFLAELDAKLAALNAAYGTHGA